MFLTKAERRRRRWHKFLEFLGQVVTVAALTFFIVAIVQIFN